MGNLFQERSIVVQSRLFQLSIGVEIDRKFETSYILLFASARYGQYPKTTSDFWRFRKGPKLLSGVFAKGVSFHKTYSGRKMMFSVSCWCENRYKIFDFRYSTLARVECSQYPRMTSDIKGSKKARKRNPGKFTRGINF